MAKGTGIEYKQRQKNFANSLNTIFKDDSQEYYLLVSRRFRELMVNEKDEEKRKKYENIANEINDNKKFTNEQISILLGVSYTTVSRWHAKEHPVLPSMETVLKIAELFQVSSDYLLGNAEKPNSDDQAKYEPFKEMGFSEKAYNNLLQIKTNNPDKYADYIRTLNIILEQQDVSYIAKSARKMPTVIKPGQELPPLKLKTLDTNPVLDVLSDYLSANGINGQCWITTTTPDDIVDMIDREIHSENYRPKNPVPAYSATLVARDFFQPFDESIYDAYTLSRLMEELKYIKAVKSLYMIQ